MTDLFLVDVALFKVGKFDRKCYPHLLLDPSVNRFIQDDAGVSYGIKVRTYPMTNDCSTWRIIFRFTNSSTAMLFKLTYGGS